MEPNWAAEHLQVIRTLMERSALYRRALAPITIFVGSVGTAAAVAGWLFSIYTPARFVTYWYVVALVTMAGAFLMVRRQAWQQSEPFWSPPTRRVAQAMLPPLAAGFLLGLLMLVTGESAAGSGASASVSAPNIIFLVYLPLAWVILYGCAIHAAGFFMARGMRLFGWGMVVCGCGACLMAGLWAGLNLVAAAYFIMGLFFGLLHLAYGTYLYFTEKRRNEA